MATFTTLPNMTLTDAWQKIPVAIGGTTDAIALQNIGYGAIVIAFSAAAPAVDSVDGFRVKPGDERRLAINSGVWVRAIRKDQPSLLAVLLQKDVAGFA